MLFKSLFTAMWKSSCWIRQQGLNSRHQYLILCTPFGKSLISKFFKTFYQKIQCNALKR